MTISATESITKDSSNNYYQKDTSIDIARKLTEQYLIKDLSDIYSDEKSDALSIDRDTLALYMTKLQDSFYNILKNKTPLESEMFLLHLMSQSLYDLNFIYFNMSYEKFRAKILFPNILYALVKHCTRAKKFIQNHIRVVYNEISHQSYGMVQKYANSYFLSEDIIKNDILFKFVGGSLRKFNPLDIDNLNNFYKQTFRSIFYYYFKREQNVHTHISDVSEIDISLSQLSNVSTRLIIYRDVLYRLQIEKFCNDSPTLFQLNYNYNIFRKAIFDNEFQSLYFTTKTDTFMLNNNQYKLLNIYYEDILDSDKLDKIRALPIIYKLLKCVHIMNPKCKSYNSRYIKPAMVKTAVLDEIIYPFKNMFGENHLYPIMNKVSENFATKILSGEYINLLTLTTIKIDQPSFINQVKQFVRICLED